MGLKDIFFNTKKDLDFHHTLDGSSPVYAPAGQRYYSYDIVQAALFSAVSELSKLVPIHAKGHSECLDPVAGSKIQKVLDNPNPLMTTSDFIEKVAWNLLLNYNSFIYPYYVPLASGKWRLEGLYPIQPGQVDFLEDATGALYVKLRFNGGQCYTMPYDYLIHIRYKYSVNDLLGGNEAGQPDLATLHRLLRLQDTLLDGIGKAMKASFSVNGILKYNYTLDRDKMVKDIADFEKKMMNQQSGILGTDLKGDFIPLNREMIQLDSETLRYLDDRAAQFYGTAKAIMTGDFTKTQYEAYYQKILEPIIVKLHQAFTRGLLTEDQRALGHKIIFRTKELIFMTTSEKLQLIDLLSPAGTLTENEKRVIFGLTPDPELEGVRKVSLNWIDSDQAAAYQLGKGVSDDDS